jgi:hypothetical protein
MNFLKTTIVGNILAGAITLNPRFFITEDQSKPYKY